jgi:hypothetical protein
MAAGSARTSGRGARGEQERVRLGVLELGVHFLRGQRRWARGSSAQPWWVRALVHGGRVGISSSTWRAAKWPAWEAILGLFRAELDLGPKTKFVKLVLLYIFRLSVMVIRLTD